MIKTSYNPPPIPCRDYDWQAWFVPDGTQIEYNGYSAIACDHSQPGAMVPTYDENGEPTVHFGSTEFDAIEALLSEGAYQG